MYLMTALMVWGLVTEKEKTYAARGRAVAWRFCSISLPLSHSLFLFFPLHAGGDGGGVRACGVRVGLRTNANPANNDEETRSQLVETVSRAITETGTEEDFKGVLNGSPQLVRHSCFDFTLFCFLPFSSDDRTCMMCWVGVVEVGQRLSNIQRGSRSATRCTIWQTSLPRESAYIRSIEVTS